MSHRNIVRAWKDEEYRLSLSDAERSRLPENPVGAIELSDTDLAAAAGGLAPLPSAGSYCNTGIHCTLTSRFSPCCF
jgi:mersacidin/lichenicidin family type 2 lantibiotic